ncbi:MAG TPA: hydantoinase/carbamoylase family amidase, partial [Terriglobales bacterium]|nr:hydantoinase/carbamoylase family amidase [Terriglobales bacterium]
MVRGYRFFLGRLCLSLATLATVAPAQNGSSQYHVNSQRLQSTLAKLSEYGRNPDGGVTRLGYSETDMAAREYVIGLMKEAGLSVRIDPAGNIFGHRDGSQKLPVILFGSHIDSVVHGGNYDGDVGSLGATEVIRALNESNTKTRHPLEVVIWTNEEGNHFGIGTLGSGIAAGLIGLEILDRKDEKGVTFADWLRRYGQDPAKLADARIRRGMLAASLELHIEQGPNLYEKKIPIGVVQGIVAVGRWDCIVSGSANHAGTTPMNRRHSALAAGSKDVLAVRDVVLSETGTQVGNVGFMKVEPGAPNVIPGRAEFPVELRDLDDAKVVRMWEHVSERFRQTDKEEGV